MLCWQVKFDAIIFEAFYMKIVKVIVLEGMKYGTQMLDVLCKFWYFNILNAIFEMIKKGKVNLRWWNICKPNFEWDNDLFHICTYCLHDFLGLLMLEFSVQEFDHGFNGELRLKLLQAWLSQGSMEKIQTPL